MNPRDFLLLGTKRLVIAISRADGRELWKTDLGGLAGDRFVTLVSDEQRVYAYVGGHLHCLELSTGTLLWSNDLPGAGYGFGSLCLPGGSASPDPAVVRMIQERDRAGSASTTD